ncbi:MAG: hypothetical protein QG574_1709 [Cyanobacteriota bacterium erpe_2018_sw_21hr_WHONDRS-SW48-000092_B_bin.40]|nr:hypothetical protein [Cyanobacteriota bacterium erpe_2018_sw_21hr_WHONDRS-SW48-000092_B_bin.40]
MLLKPSEESEAARVKQKFGKGSELTKVFEEWDESVRVFLFAHSNLAVGEIPIVACYQSEASWVLLTTRRTIWTDPDDGKCELKLEEIEDIGLSSDLESRRSLFVFDSSGGRYEVYLEPGRTLVAMRHAIWQLLSGWRKSSGRPERTRAGLMQADPPTTGSDAYKALRLEKSLLKQSQVYSTKLFRSLTVDWQDFLLAEAQLQPEELPVFAFVEDSETWFLATSRRVLWSRPSFKHQLRYGQIRKMGMSELDMVMRQYEASGDWDAWKEKIGVLKSSSPWFYFVDDRGLRWDVLLPPGGPLYAIWSVMRFMVQLERIHPCQA